MCTECTEPVSHAFGLTYASYFVRQRSALEAMPLEWQRRFVALMDELDAAVDFEQLPDKFWVRATDGKRFISDPWSDYRRGRRVPMKPPATEKL